MQNQFRNSNLVKAQLRELMEEAAVKVCWIKILET